MTLKGEWSGDVTYNVGDIMRYPNGIFYQCVKAPKAGTPCANALYFVPLPSPLQEAAKMIMDMVGELASMVSDVEAKIPTNISDEAITLSTETADYLVTVDDSGETPELAVTAIEEEADT